MRYLWDLYPAYLREWTPAWKRVLMAPAAHYLRLWDYAAAQRVDDFIANSQHTSHRIWRCYRRESQVIHPPVVVDTFFWKPPKDFFLIVSELVSYKRIDSAVRLFAQTGHKLRIVGAGPEYSKLKRLARDNIEFCGRVSDHDLRELYAHCRAFVMPGEEDFGIAAVEALASGKPVIALARGGALETVPRDRPAGVFYCQPCEADLADALVRFERVEPLVEPAALQRHAAAFSESEFSAKMARILGLPGIPAAQYNRHRA
jgi:glycosyltransferase involved in cell wall biosynthesis